MEALLKRLYYSLDEGLGGVNDLYRKAKLQDKTVTLKKVKEFLKAQEPYQVTHRRHIKNHYPLSTYTNFGRIQIDLADMSSEVVSVNKGYKWIFCLIDTYSKVGYAVPMKSKNDTDVYNAYTSIINKIFETYNEVPYQVDSDSESSFRSKRFIKFNEKEHIKQNFSQIGDKKSTGFIERWIGTLRHMIRKYQTAYNTNDWVSALPALVNNYNNAYHSSLHKSPIEALKDNSFFVEHMRRQTEKAKGKTYNKEDIKVGDTVRLKIKTKILEKAQEAFTKTIHTVERIENGQFFVTQRVNPYKKYELLKVDKVERKPHTEVIQQRVEHQQVRRVAKRINKEGIKANLHEPTDEERSQRAIRRRPRDMGPYLS